MIHEINIDKSYADAIVDGRKKFEVRLNDKGYNAGDKVKYEVYEGGFIYCEHPLNQCVYDITYVHSGLGMKENYVVFGIDEDTCQASIRDEDEEFKKQLIEIVQKDCGDREPPSYYDAGPITRQILKKQEPMQVELEADGYADGFLCYDYGKCPRCGWQYEEGDKDWEEPFCCHCGQKLKWFEE